MHWSGTNQKFIRRFNYLEEKTIQTGRSLKEMTLEEMDKIWDEAKAKGFKKQKGNRHHVATPPLNLKRQN